MPTMIVKAAPLFATILCRWLGRLAIPMGDALSAAGGAIVELGLERGDNQRSTGLLINKAQLDCDRWRSRSGVPVVRVEKGREFGG